MQDTKNVNWPLKIDQLENEQKNLGNQCKLYGNVAENREINTFRIIFRIFVSRGYPVTQFSWKN